MRATPKERARAGTLVLWISWLLLPLFTLPAQAAAAPIFRISPAAEALFADPLHIVLEGLAPGSDVEISAERSMGAPSPSGHKVQLFRSSARFVADAAGMVDLARQAPASGSYSGVDPMGLFWSMSATEDPAGAERYEEVRLIARVAGEPLASAAVKLRGWSPDVRTEEIPGFPGAVFARPPGSEKLPVIVVLGGSEGGAGVARVMAPMFASRGYAAVGLPYYSPPDQSGRREIEGLPASFADIPIDRLDQLRSWLAGRTDVDADRIGIWGMSKGAEYALVAAAYYPWIRSVAASVPSDVVWEGWGQNVVPGTRASFAFQGKPLPFVPYDYRRQAGGIKAFMDDGRSAHPERAASARIRVENVKGAVLVAGAGQDATWASAHMAQNIAERRAEAGLATRLLIFPDVGHVLAGDPWTPKGQGAAAAAESQAQRKSWEETFAFFEQTLRSKE